MGVLGSFVMPVATELPLYKAWWPQGRSLWAGPPQESAPSGACKSDGDCWDPLSSGTKKLAGPEF